MSQWAASGPAEAGNPDWNRDTQMAGLRCWVLRVAKGSDSRSHCLARLDSEILKRPPPETGASHRSGKVLRLENYDSSNCRNPTRTRLRSVDEAPALHAAALRQGDDVPCARCLSRRNGANRIDRRRPVLRAVGSRFANAKKETVSPGTSLAPEHPVSGSVRYLCQNGASLLRNPNSSLYQNSRDS